MPCRGNRAPWRDEWVNAGKKASTAIAASLVSTPVYEGHIVRAVAAKLPETARTTLAGLSDEPWLCITETCVTDDGRVVLHATDFHRGDIFAFHVVRQRSEGPPVPNRL